MEELGDRESEVVQVGAGGMGLLQAQNTISALGILNWQLGKERKSKVILLSYESYENQPVKVSIDLDVKKLWLANTLIKRVLVL